MAANSARSGEAGISEIAATTSFAAREKIPAKEKTRGVVGGSSNSNAFSSNSCCATTIVRCARGRRTNFGVGL